MRGSITYIWKEMIDILKVFNGIYKFLASKWDFLLSARIPESMG